MFVGPEPFESRLPQQAVLRPLAERDLRDELRFHPMDRLAPRRIADGKGILRRFNLIKSVAQVEERLARVASPDLPRVCETAEFVVVAGEKRAEADAGTLRVGEAADDKLLPAEAFELHPRGTAAGGVGRVPVLCENPLFAPSTCCA